MSVLGTNLQVVVTFYWFCNHFLILYSSTWFYFAGRMVVWGKHGEPRSCHICWHLFIMYHQDSVIHVWYICDKFLISLFHFLDLRNIHVLIVLFLLSPMNQLTVRRCWDPLYWTQIYHFNHLLLFHRLFSFTFAISRNLYFLIIYKRLVIKVWLILFYAG